jgi:hypothetical protein
MIFSEEQRTCGRGLLSWRERVLYGQSESSRTHQTEPPARRLAMIATPPEFSSPTHRLTTLSPSPTTTTPSANFVLLTLSPLSLKITSPIICRRSHTPPAPPHPRTLLTSSKMSSSLRTIRTPCQRHSLLRTYSQGLMTPPNFIPWLA